MRLPVLLLAAVVVPLAILGKGGATEGDRELPLVPGQLLVRYRDGGAPQIGTAGDGATFNEALDVWRIDVGDESQTEQLAARLRADPTVKFVQPQYVYERAVEPDDPLYQSKQHVHYRTINLQAAWAGGTPASEVVVAVIDGGVDVGHPELDSRIWMNVGETPDGIDEDGNGCIDDVTGCSFQSSPPDGAVQDQDGHGTFVAGLIAAERNNAQGVAGIASNALIMPVRALDSQGAGTTEQLAGSILYAARNGADVLNLSLVLPPIGFTCPTDPIVEEALREAVEDYGATVVAASGNYGIDCVGFPGSSVHTIAVGGSGPSEDSDSHAFFAQWGPEVDVAAPAIGLVSTCPDPTPIPTPYCPGTPYGEGDGTSFSAPIAVGVVALLLGSNPTQTPEEVRQLLRDTARNVPDENRPNWDGKGIIDAGAALAAGSAWSSVDLRGDDLSSLSLRVLVGNAGSPLCEARIWGVPDFPVSKTSSTLGVGECAAYWPPAAQQPWRLAAESTGDKAQVVNRWSLTSGGLSCSAPGMPLNAPVGTVVTATIDCSNGAQIDNDSVSNARNVPADTLPRRYQEDIRYASAAGNPATACAGVVSRTVWYRLAPGAPMDLEANTFGTGFDTVLAVYRETGGPLTEVTCNDDFRGPQSRVAWKADGASAYLVMAGAYGAVPATTLRVSFGEAAIPANDDGAMAIPLPQDAGAPFVQPAHSALADPGDPDMSCTGVYGASLWFTVTESASGPLTVSSAGSTYNTVLAVLDGGTEVACSNDAAPGNQTSRATWAAVAGREYRVVVGSFLARAGGTLKVAVATGP
jgi:subtilisin family serine protease